MQRFILKYLSFLSLFLLVQNIKATTIDSLPVILLSDTLIFQKLPNQQIGFVEDASNQLRLADLSHQSLDTLENRTTIEVSQNGFNYWAVIKLVNATNNEQTWWLEVPGNYADVWVHNATEQIEKVVTGNLLKQSEKAIPNKFRNFNYLPINFKANEKLIIKLNIRTGTFFPIYNNAINIGKPLYFENFQNQRLGEEGFYNGLYSAIMFTFFLYCIGYFILTREIFALWAALYGLALIGYFYQFDSTWYRLGFSPVLVQYAGISLMNFALLFNFLLVRKYLNLKTTMPYWDKIFLWAIYVLSGYIILHLLFYYISQQYLLYLLIILVVHSFFYIPPIIVAIKEINKPKSLNIIFSVGLVTSHGLMLYNNMQLSNLSNALLQIGVSFYIVTLFISLSIRAARNQKQKIEAEQARIIDSLKLAELQKLDKVKTNFFTNISHELRTPLTLIIGPISSVLKNSQLNTKNSALLKKAKESGEDLLKLVNSLLDFSKLEAAKIQLEESPITIFNLTRKVAATFESYANQKNIDYTFVYQAEKTLILKLDKDKTTTILNNLLANALKFTPSGGTVTFEVIDTGRTLNCIVHDSGAGIHPQDIDYIFDRFYQSSQPHQSISGGTGIGLALSKEFALLMQGNITVKSQLNQGSIFTLALPRKEVLGTLAIEDKEETHKIPTSEDAIPTILSNKKTLGKKRHQLLIVEDNSSLASYLKTILSPYFNIQAARNGQVALNLLSNNLTEKQNLLPDLILSDIMMPEMDGFQLLEILKAETTFSQIPVIMLTARADKKDKLKALRIGVDDYLLKPFEEEELLARINNLLNNAKQRKTVLEQEKEMPIISQEIAIWLESVEQLVRKNIANTIFSIPFMASELAMTERSLQRQLKKATGLTPKQYLQEIRLSEARQMLEDKKYNTIAKIAYTVGFADPKTFSQRFKQRYGKLPSSYL